MSRKNKPTSCEIAAVILAATFVWCPLYMAQLQQDGPWSAVRYPEHPDWKGDQTKGDKPPTQNWAPGYNDAAGVKQIAHYECYERETVGECAARVVQAGVRRFNLFLVIVGVSQAAVGVLTFYLLRRQTKILLMQAKITRGEPFLAIITKKPLREVFRVTTGTILYDQMEGASFQEPPVLEFWVKNYGTSPAVLASVGARLAIAPTAPSAQTSYPVIMMPGERIAESGIDAGPFPATLRSGQQSMSRALYGDLMAGRQFIWLCGEIRYDTIWGDYFIANLCWRYDLGADEFRPDPPERNKTESRPGPHRIAPERELGI